MESFAKEKQPLYTAHNYYGDGVPPYDRDHTSVKSDTVSDAKITMAENGEVYLEMTLDEAFATLKGEIVDTERLGIPRISELPFEAPDGSRIVVNVDLFGNSRGANPTTGPIEGLCAGKVNILLTK